LAAYGTTVAQFRSVVHGLQCIAWQAHAALATAECVTCRAANVRNVAVVVSVRIWRGKAAARSIEACSAVEAITARVACLARDRPVGAHPSHGCKVGGRLTTPRAVSSSSGHTATVSKLFTINTATQTRCACIRLIHVTMCSTRQFCCARYG